MIPTRIGSEPAKEEYQTLNELVATGAVLEPIGDSMPMEDSLRPRKFSKIEEVKKKNFGILVNNAREKFEGLVASVLCELKKEISRVALYKILFYCDFAHYKKYNTPITGMPYVHLQNGPVPAGNDSYDLFDKDMVSQKILKLRELNEEGNDDYIAAFFIAGRKAKDYCKILTPLEHDTVTSVLNQLKNETTRELRNLTHEERAFSETQKFDIIDYSFATSLTITP